MQAYVLRRLIAMVPTWLIVMFAVVTLVRLIPGSIVDLLVEGQGGVGVQGGRAIERSGGAFSKRRGAASGSFRKTEGAVESGPSHRS